MKPRKRKFKRDNKLKFAYIKNHYDLGSDFIGTIPKGESGRWDIYFLFYFFLNRPIHDKEYNRETKQWEEPPTFIKELENRGYDISTIYFEIEKKEVKEDD